MDGEGDVGSVTSAAGALAAWLGLWCMDAWCARWRGTGSAQAGVSIIIVHREARQLHVWPAGSRYFPPLHPVRARVQAVNRDTHTDTPHDRRVQLMMSQPCR